MVVAKEYEQGSIDSDSKQTPQIYYIHHWFGVLSTEHAWTKSTSRILFVVAGKEILNRNQTQWKVSQTYARIIEGVSQI